MQTMLTKRQASLPIEAEIRARLEHGHDLEYSLNRAVTGLNIHTREGLVQQLYRYIGAWHQISPGLQMVWLRQTVDERTVSLCVLPLVQTKDT